MKTITERVKQLMDELRDRSLLDGVDPDIIQDEIMPFLRGYVQGIREEAAADLQLQLDHAIAAKEHIFSNMKRNVEYWKAETKRLDQLIRDSDAHEHRCNKVQAWHDPGKGIFSPAPGDNVDKFQPCSCWIAQALVPPLNLPPKKTQAPANPAPSMPPGPAPTSDTSPL